MSEEKFREFPLQEYANKFTISNRGKIYSNRKKEYLNTEVSDGYNVIFIKKISSTKRQLFRIDRLVAEAFIGSSCENYLRHKDGNKLNDEATNLEWISIPNYLSEKYESTWKQIRDMPYYVSANGQIWSLSSDSLIKQQLVSGYMSVNIGYPKQLFQHVHRLVCSAFWPNPNKKPIVNHKDGNKMNNTADNLEWTTASENVRHALTLRPNKKKTIVDRGNPNSTDFCIELDWLPGYYIFDTGAIYSIKSRVFMIQHLNNNGYYRVCPSLNGKLKYFYVHRLVAEAYLSDSKKPEHTQVNHKNMNRLDNDYKNLEWCTPSENVAQSKTTNTEQFSHYQKSVAKIDINTGDIVETYKGIKVASKQTGINSGSIVKVCKGIKPTAGGFSWKYM